MVRRTMIWRRILGFDLSHTESDAARIYGQAVTLKVKQYIGQLQGHQTIKHSTQTIPGGKLCDAFQKLGDMGIRAHREVCERLCWCVSHGQLGVKYKIINYLSRPTGGSLVKY
jgi:hypothetical protein